MTASRDERLDAAIALREGGAYEAACEALTELSREHPSDVQVLFHTAWAHDKAEREEEALPFYERALGDPGSGPVLSAFDRREAMLGMGSTFRVLGRAHEAVAVLQRATEEFPADHALQVFLTMARFDDGEQAAAFGSLLSLVLTVTDDEAIQDYKRPIAEYAQAYRHA